MAEQGQRPRCDVIVGGLDERGGLAFCARHDGLGGLRRRARIWRDPRRARCRRRRRRRGARRAARGVSRPAAARRSAFVSRPISRPHIEQGPVLEAAGATIGVVTGIQGKKTFEVELAATRAMPARSPMAERRDALAAFVAHRVGAVCADRRARRPSQVHDRAAARRTERAVGGARTRADAHRSAPPRRGDLGPARRTARRAVSSPCAAVRGRRAPAGRRARQRLRCRAAKAASSPPRTSSACPTCACCRRPATTRATWRHWGRAR